MRVLCKICGKAFGCYRMLNGHMNAHRPKNGVHPDVQKHDRSSSDGKAQIDDMGPGTEVPDGKPSDSPPR